VSQSFSLRYPDRESLADALRRLNDAGMSLESTRDDGVNEALVVRDPDGNRVELYAVRPRDQWPVASDGSVHLSDDAAVDLEALGRARHPRPAEQPQASPGQPPLSPLTRTRLGEMRTRLLNLHKVLLDDAKAAYELDRGRVTSNANLLQLVINDPWFAWLHPLSELVVRIDETLQADAPATEPDGAMLLEQVGRLLSPNDSGDGFAQRYYEALQRQPAVIMAHAEVRRILKQAR
jgi:hypothetical protein